MNQTTNYNFNVPVGSDIVNPLVQDFPNWESLDSILRNVANTGITTATHTKTGTIHTLTFSETTVPMIRFQATADFNTNDTFTVNGLSVSALTVTGEALPNGAFVIGSMVLCELRDNLLTVYTSGTDANTLEGHPASYFATDSDLQTVDDKADANRVLIDQINTDLLDKAPMWKTVGSVDNVPLSTITITLPYSTCAGKRVRLVAYSGMLIVDLNMYSSGSNVISRMGSVINPTADYKSGFELSWTSESATLCTIKRYVNNSGAAFNSPLEIQVCKDY